MWPTFFVGCIHPPPSLLRILICQSGEGYLQIVFFSMSIFILFPKFDTLSVAKLSPNPSSIGAELALSSADQTTPPTGKVFSQLQLIKYL